MILKSISRNSFLLALFAAFTTALIAGTYMLTKERIAEQKRQAENRALLEIFPHNTHDNNPLDDVLILSKASLLGLDKKSVSNTEGYRIHVVRKNKKIVGFIFPVVAPEAYADEIHLLVGIKSDASIAGVRVISHKETPGLGDAIEVKKSGWILGFNGKSLNNPKREQWKVRKDQGVFDQFTGATITPRAVIKALVKSLSFYQQNSDILIKTANQEKRNIPSSLLHNRQH